MSRVKGEFEIKEVKRQAREMYKKNAVHMILICALTSIISGTNLSAVITEGTSQIEYIYTFLIFDIDVSNLIVGLSTSMVIGLMIMGFLFTVLIVNPLVSGIMNYLKSIVIGESDTSIIFFAFQKGQYKRVVLTNLWITLKVLLGIFLFIIPGIIWMIQYLFSSYVLYDYPDLSEREVMKKSSELTYGNKMDIFLLMLSFILWYLLAGLIPFGNLLIAPYVTLSGLFAYLTIKGTVDATETIVEEVDSIDELL